MINVFLYMAIVPLILALKNTFFNFLPANQTAGIFVWHKLNN